jgi:hypothetical protein
VGDRSRRSAKRLWAKIPQAYRRQATFYTDQYVVYEGARRSGDSSRRARSRKEGPKTNKGDRHPFETTVLCAMTVPKRGLLGNVASVGHHGAVVPLP